MAELFTKGWSAGVVRRFIAEDAAEAFRGRVVALPATADPVFDMLATIALAQGADPEEVACAYETSPYEEARYWLAIGERAYSLSAASLEEGRWPAYLASAMAASANDLPTGVDLAAYAEYYEQDGGHA